MSEEESSVVPESYESAAAGRARPEENVETEGQGERVTDKREGLAEQAKQKGEELLDKVSGPDVPPTLPDEEERS